MQFKLFTVVRLLFFAFIISKSLIINAKSISSIFPNANSIQKIELSDSLSISENLFYKGKKLYERNKFKESISFFEKAYKLDSLLYFESRPQILTYVGMWIGNAKRKAGISIEKKLEPEYIYQYSTPIDYHLTNEIDSLSNIARRHFNYALYYPNAKNKLQHLDRCVFLMQKRGELLDSIVGTDHIWTANNNLLLSYYCYEISRYYQQNIFRSITDINAPHYSYFNYATDCLKKYEAVAKTLYTDNPYLQIYYLNDIRNILLYGNSYQNSNTCRFYLVKNEYLFQIDAQLLPLIEKHNENNYSLLSELHASLADSLSYYYYMDRSVSELDVRRSDKHSSMSLMYAQKQYDENPNSENEMFLMQRKSDVAYNMRSLYNTMCREETRNCFSNEEKFERLDSAINIRLKLSSFFEKIGADSLAMENQLETARLLEDLDGFNQLNNYYDRNRFEKVWAPERYGDSTLPNDVIDDLNEFNVQNSLSSLLISAHRYRKDTQTSDSLNSVITKIRLGQEQNIDRFFSNDTLEYYRRMSDLIFSNRKHSQQEAVRLSHKLYDYACNNSDVSFQISALGDLAFEYELNKDYKMAADLYAEAYDKCVTNGQSGAIYHYANSSASNYVSYIEENKDSLFVSTETNCQQIYAKAAIYYSLAAENSSEQSTWVEEKLKEEYALLHAGDTCKAAQVWTEAVTKRLEAGRKAMMYLVPKDRDYIWNMRYKSAVDDCTRKAVQHATNGYYADMAYNAQLFSKGAMLLYESRFIRIKESVDSTEYQNFLITSKDTAEYTKQLSMTWQDVQNAMHEDDIAIEFVEYVDNNMIFDINYGESKPIRNEIYSLLDKPNIGALILMKHGTPHFVHICHRDSLQSILKNTPKDDYYNSKLYNTVWNKIESEAKGCNNIYFSPVGIFHTIAIESLCDESGKTLTDKYQVYRLTSTRSIALQDNNDVNLCTLYGGLKYDLTEKEWTSNPEYNDRVRGQDMDISCVEREAYSGLEELPGSLTEVDSVACILRMHSKTVHLRTKEFGLEESLLYECEESPNILHFSTHGFYDATGNDATAMDNCGLFLSGASYILENGEAQEGHKDGVLLAREIAEMNMHSVTLVVLSACQTGLGNVTPDGVFGLQRGFKLAGAKSLIMSLWKVDDNATCKLITQFYSNWMSKKMTKYEALETAKKTVSQTKGWEDPKFWAAFILLDGLD